MATENFAAPVFTVGNMTQQMTGLGLLENANGKVVPSRKKLSDKDTGNARKKIAEMMFKTGANVVADAEGKYKVNANARDRYQDHLLTFLTDNQDNSDLAFQYDSGRFASVTPKKVVPAPVANHVITPTILRPAVEAPITHKPQAIIIEEPVLQLDLFNHEAASLIDGLNADEPFAQKFRTLFNESLSDATVQEISAPALKAPHAVIKKTEIQPRLIELGFIQYNEKKLERNPDLSTITEEAFHESNDFFKQLIEQEKEKSFFTDYVTENLPESVRIAQFSNTLIQKTIDDHNDRLFNKSWYSMHDLPQKETPKKEQPKQVQQDPLLVVAQGLSALGLLKRDKNNQFVKGQDFESLQDKQKNAANNLVKQYMAEKGSKSVYVQDDGTVKAKSGVIIRDRNNVINDIIAKQPTASMQLKSPIAPQQQTSFATEFASTRLREPRRPRRNNIFTRVFRAFRNPVYKLVASMIPVLGFGGFLMSHDDSTSRSSSPVVPQANFRTSAYDDTAARIQAQRSAAVENMSQSGISTHTRKEIEHKDDLVALAHVQPVRHVKAKVEKEAIEPQQTAPVVEIANDQMSDTQAQEILYNRYMEDMRLMQENALDSTELDSTHVEQVIVTSDTLNNIVNNAQDIYFQPVIKADSTIQQSNEVEFEMFNQFIRDFNHNSSIEQKKQITPVTTMKNIPR